MVQWYDWQPGLESHHKKGRTLELKYFEFCSAASLFVSQGKLDNDVHDLRSFIIGAKKLLEK